MNLVIETNEADFKSEVLDSTQPVLVDFWGERCDSSEALAPLLEEIARENAGRVKIVTVNVDENPALAGHYHIQFTPTLIYFSNGLVHDHLVNPADKRQIVSKLNVVAAVLRQQEGQARHFPRAGM
jgi:thioredoxin 1